jgi:hypothetical protein
LWTLARLNVNPCSREPLQKELMNIWIDG